MSAESLPTNSTSDRGKYPLWLPLVGLVAGFVLASVFASISQSLQGRSQTFTSPGPITLLVDELGLWLCFFFAAYVGSKRYGTGRLRQDFGISIRLWPDIPLGLIIGAVCQLVVVPLAYLPFEIGDPTLSRSLSKPAQNLVGSSRSVGQLLVGLIIVFGAPFMEELFFRGLLLRTFFTAFGGVMRKAGTPLAVVLSAVVFALVHFEALQFLGLVIVGTVLGIAAVRTKRIGLSIFIHMGFNMVAFVAITLTR